MFVGSVLAHGEKNGIADQELSPEVLIQQVGQGKRLAEEQLVSKYWRGLYFILQRRTNDPELAADLAQDTFIIVIKKARSGEITNPAAIVSFIRQTGINLMIAHFRKETRQATDPDSQMDLHIADQSPGLFQKLQSEQSFELVLQLLEEMKVERDREIIKSYFLYEQEKSAICNALDLSPEHFDRVLHRARNRLKQLIIFKLGSNNESIEREGLANVIILILMISIIVLSSHKAPLSKNYSKSVRDIRLPHHFTSVTSNYGRCFNSGEEYELHSNDQLRFV
ncbi:MAG: sigma-70 family RNA polymerase sigma factor [Gammaproteobacteria bacterium]|nr:sigma-70 family RNA polymerase sigma factor [Gammaproteobacteria bacterium]